MRRQDQRPDEWPTFLWIAWREGETDRVESLCRAHRAYVYERYAASAHGLNRRGERCGMCRPQPLRTAELAGPGHCATASGEPRVAPSRGHGARGSRRRVSPIRHGASPPPGSAQR
jgi:hypothetical protein